MDLSGIVVGKKLIIDGYVYLKSRERNGKTYWDCNRLRKGECNARAVTVMNNEDVIILRGPAQSIHDTSPPNREEGEAEVIVHRVKRVASSHPEQPPAQIIRVELADVPIGVLTQLPERPNLAKAMRKHRRKDLPANPKYLKDLGEIPERFTKNLSREKFLIRDFESEEGRVLVFATRRNLELLARSSTWEWVMGRVPKNPRIPTAASEYVTFPFVYALLSSKETVQYTTVLEAIDTAAREYGIGNCKPQKIMGDFEKAIINACADIYPGTDYSGCFYHLCQSLYRKIQAEGLQVQYNNPINREIKVWAHTLMALAFFPEEDVALTLEFVEDEIPEELFPIVDYIKEFYVIGRPGRGRRRAVPPRYPVSIWNQYKSAREGRHKTNNSSEGWHNRFRLLVGKHHPDLYSALKEFQKEQADVEIMIAELSLGRSVKATPKKKWIEVQNRLRSIVLQYEEYKNSDTVSSYLTLLEHNIAL